MQADINGIAFRRASSISHRQISAGAIWNVGGSAVVQGSVAAIPNGRGGLLASGTNAPLFTASFFNKTDQLRTTA